MRKRAYIIFSFLLLSFWAPAQNQQKDLSAEEFNKKMNTKNTVVIDLRTPPEIASKGKIKGAMEIDYLSKDAEAKIKALDKSKTYLLYCAGGGRSGECMELMTKNGFKQVYHMNKGFSDWLKQGYEIEKQNN